MADKDFESPVPTNAKKALSWLKQAGTEALSEVQKAKKQVDERREVAGAKRATSKSEIGKAIASETLMTGSFGVKKVTIYQNGFVKVGINSPEVLLSISASDGTATKSALGRGVGAVVTLGINMHASKLRGQAYLAIGTASDSYILHLQSPQPREIAAIHKLAAAGQAAIATRESLENSTNNVDVKPVNDLAGQLNQLVELHSQGLLSDEEFASAKAQLLGIN